MGRILKASTGAIAAIALAAIVLSIILILIYEGVIKIPLLETSTTTTVTTPTGPTQTTDTVTSNRTTITITTPTTSIQSTSTSTTTRPPSPDKITIQLECKSGNTEEAGEAYSNAGNYCWGWLGTHTYDLGNPVQALWVKGTVVIGPSEGGRTGMLYVEVSKDGESYDTVYTREGVAGGELEFNISLNRLVRTLRIRVEPEPMNPDWISVDNSYLSLSINTSGLRLFEYDCRQGVHLEAQEAYSRSGDYCWGWIQNHTYHIGEPRKLAYAIIYVKLGPTGFTGNRREVTIQLSKDGTTWNNIYNRQIFQGGPISILVVPGSQEVFEYIRISGPSNGYVDFSKIYVLVTQ